MILKCFMTQKYDKNRSLWIICLFLIFSFYFDHLHLLGDTEVQAQHCLPLASVVATNNRDGRHCSVHNAAAVHLHVGLHYVVNCLEAPQGLWKKLPVLEYIGKQVWFVVLQVVDKNHKDESGETCDHCEVHKVDIEIGESKYQERQEEEGHDQVQY